MTTAIILAGGLGTRLRGVVPDLPKPMAPIGGRPFLEFQLDYWIAQGVSRFILSIGYKHEAFTSYFGARYKNAELEYVIEQTPLGTGGGLLLAAKKIRDDASFLLLNGDTYFSSDLSALSEFSQKNRADWCFSLFRTGEKDRYLEVETSPNGEVVSFGSKSGRSSFLANGGVYWVNPRSLSGLGAAPGGQISLESDIFRSALAGGQRLFGIEFSGTFIDIGVPEDYHRASKLLMT